MLKINKQKNCTIHFVQINKIRKGYDVKGGLFEDTIF
jgi:hypothetical protein